jgi:hypothetical protein
MAKGYCEMGFPESRGSEEQKVLVTVDPRALGELREVSFFNSRHPAEFEILEALYDGEMGHGEAAFEASIAAIL